MSRGRDNQAGTSQKDIRFWRPLDRDLTAPEELIAFHNVERAEQVGKPVCKWRT
jgi:hypothetical protein